MAAVFKARHTTTNEIVAVKVLAPQLAMQDNFMQRFKREAQVLRDLSHPNIVPILDFGESMGFSYLVMPLMKVGGLDDRLNDGPLQLEEGVRIIGQVASALQYAHDQGVVHRDVKPSNILIDEDGNAWLADFGFAHVHDATVSLTGSALIGTPAYMAPEQVLGGGVTRKTDQYALGVVLFQVCTGQLPFDSETPMAIAFKHAADPLPQPRSVNPNLPDAVEWVLIKALLKDPDHRFGSVDELYEAFRDAIHNAIDVRAGVLKGGARSPSPVVEEFRRTGRTQSDHVEANTLILGGTQSQPRRSLPVLLILLLFAVPLGVFAGIRFGPGLFASASDSPVIAGAPGLDIEATIAAVSTANAPKEGTAVKPGQVQTAVAATLTAISTDRINPTSETIPASSESPEKASATPTSTDVRMLGTEGTPTSTASPTEIPTEDYTPLTPGEPTPSVTVTMTLTLTPTPTLTSTVTPTLNPTDATLTSIAATLETYTPTTWVSPTFTPTPTKTLTMTKTPTMTKTVSPSPSVTVTTVSPTASTVSPTWLPTKTPSSTTPTTIVKTPTTEAVVTDPCDGITLGGFQRGGDNVQWKITNDSGSPIYIIAIVLDWPSKHERLNEVLLRGNPIWTKGSDLSPTVITFSDLKPIRKIDHGKSSVLKFIFMKEWNGLAYGLGLRFHQGCDIAKVN
jgi:hypothetical protein